MSTNHSLNLLKFISAFAVVYLHCRYIANSEIIITGLERTAVPIFFLISGFYSYYKDNDLAFEKYKTRSLRLMILIIISNLLYFLIDNFQLLINHNYQTLFSNLPSIYAFLFLNAQIKYHLWFLGALLYCYFLLIIFYKLTINPKKLYKLIPVLFLMNLIMGEFFGNIGIIIPKEYYRNFLFTGLPFFMLGYFIHDYQNVILSKLSNKFLLISIILLSFLTIIELLTVKTIDLTIGPLFLATILFIYCVKNPKMDLKVIGWIGGALYSYIYILHPISIEFIQYINLNINYLMPILTFSLTIIISYVIYSLKKYINL